jgi:BirA family biotin operon repressor/biotin-[acetyl-CoA-carboxylase] ligase
MCKFTEKGDEGVKKELLADKLLARGISAFEYDTLDSTNSEARRYALDGKTTPAIFVAKHQSEGRGRCGRSFYSPDSTGLYMTLLLDVTDDAPSSVVKLTTCAAVATASALQESFGADVGIKWVNDIYVGEKKVSGILAESFSSEARRYVVIGVGVNLSTKRFPSDIEHIAGSLGIEDTECVRTELAQLLGARLFDMYERIKIGDVSYIEEYKKLSIVLGREVTYTVNGECFEGIAEDIREDGGLCIVRPNGTKTVLSSGEISLRIKKEDER